MIIVALDVIRPRRTFVPVVGVCLSAMLGVYCSALADQPVAEEVLGISVVAGGESSAVVVVGDDACDMIQYAAGEFTDHIRKATGVTIEVVNESALDSARGGARIFMGNTLAAKRLNIDPEAMPRDAFRILSVGGDLFIIGREPKGETFDLSGKGGSDTLYGGVEKGVLYGVYELLERSVGVLWLWPGELGTVVPRQDTITIRIPCDEGVEPAFAFRRYRAWRVRNSINRGYEPDIARLAYTPEGLEAYGDDLYVYLARHRIGYSEEKPTVGHYFAGWWERFGEAHPEWFMMREDGERGPPPGATDRQKRHVAMCVSNTDLHRFLVEENWDGGDVLSLGEVDVRVFCQCPECEAWDVVSEQPDFIRYEPLVSERYARFWKTIHDEAVKRNPNVKVTSFLYWNYLPAPTSDIDLRGVYGEYVPWGNAEVTYYPMSDEAHQWNKDQWQGWSERGVTMAYRPNYLLGGYVMPHLSTWQAADMFQFAAEHGMVGLDYDSLWAHWSVGGPMYYIHMRLTVDPARDVGELRQEYFSGFGPAAGLVEAYFDYWEAYSANEAQRGGVGYNNPTTAHTLYPPESFTPAFDLLDKAFESAEQDADPVYAERVYFLIAGLEHARLSARFMGLLERGGALPLADPERFLKAREALLELVEFRRDHEHLYIADYLSAAAIENRRIDIDTLLNTDIKSLERGGQGMDREKESLFGQWYVRLDDGGLGQEEGWYSPDAPASITGIEVSGGDDGGIAMDESLWAAVPVPSSLEEAGFGRYLGYSWYATTFTPPDAWRGQTLLLHFEGVDEQAWIYLNGAFLGEHTVQSENLPVGDLWNRPFTISIEPEQIRWGRENLLVIRTHASAGAAGIWQPVSLEHADDLY